MVANHRKTSLSISRLHLDPQNPRVGRGAQNEAEALQRLLDRFGNQIVSLARDIATYGLDPTQSWAVVKEHGQFIVVEGNRRLVACRLLLYPGKAPTPEFRRKFERIKITADIDSVSKISCVNFDTRQACRHWIQIKHHGEKQGTGTVSWGPEMVYLDQLANGGRKEGWNEFWFWLENTYNSDYELSGLIAGARNSQYTTMERLYNWALRERLQASLDTSGTITCSVDPYKIRPFIKTLLIGIISKGDTFTVDDISEVLPTVSSRTTNDQDDTKDVIDTLWKHTIGDNDITAPKPSKDATPQTEPPDAPPTSNTGDQSSPNPPASRKTSTGKGGNSRPTKSETNLYAGVTARNKLPGRLKDLLTECSKIVVDDSPETAAVMARVAVELTADALIEKRSITVKSKKADSPTLQEKLKAVLFHLDPAYDSPHPTLPLLRGAWAAIRANEHDSGHLVKDLNDSVHVYTFTATLDIARRANKTLTPLMQQMVEDIRNS